MKHSGRPRSLSSKLLVVPVALSLSALGALALSGCNTARGIAADLSETGDNIVETTEDIGRTLGGDDSDN